jgi:hypothetical protein
VRSPTQTNGFSYHQIVSKIIEDAELKRVTSFSVAGIAAEIFVEIKSNLYTGRGFSDYYHIVNSIFNQYSDACQCLDIAAIEMEWDEICHKSIDLSNSSSVAKT